MLVADQGQHDALVGLDANGRGVPSASALTRIAEAWRPWRAYAAMHLWHALASPKQGEPIHEPACAL